MVRPKLLIVDDHPEGLIALEAVLSRPDYELVKASSGREALKLCLQEDFAVILLDVQMPDMDGFETAALIRSRDRSRDTPIIMVTAINKEDSYIFKGYQSGAVDYVFKPFDPLTLRMKVAVFVDIFRKRSLVLDEADRHHEEEVARIEADNSLRYRNLADAVPHFVWRATAAGQLEYANQPWRSLTGMNDNRTLGDGWQTAIHSDDLPKLLDGWRAAKSTQTHFEVECRIRENGGAPSSMPKYSWHLVRGIPERDHTGEVIAWIVSGTQIDDRKREEERAHFLACAGSALAESLDLSDVLQSITSLAVPGLGNWCWVHRARGDQGVELAAIGHSDPARRESARLALESSPLPLEAEFGPGAVIRSGKAEVLADLTAGATLPGLASSPAQVQWLASLGARSMACVPLRARKRVIGSLTFLSEVRQYSTADLQLLEDFAARAALALSNALLYEDAQRAIRARDEFLSIASHELKTPLTPLKIQTQTFRMLLDRGHIGTISPKKLGWMLETSDRQVEKLSTLIEEMLDISRISIGKLVQRFEDFDLRCLVDEVAERFRSELEAAGCTLEVEATREISVKWDRFRMEQALANLIGNAVKYGKGKPIRISAVVEGADKVRLSVRDFGIGIDPKDQARIFERFERAVSAQHFGGLGLGLYITRQIVQAHGGAIWVKSAPDHGAEFTVLLPVDSEAAALGAQGAPAVNETAKA